LINEVRDRAGVPDLELSNFASKEDLNDAILQERGWEFYFEMKRREDLVRHDKLISNAQSRGIETAQQKHVLFPISQNVMDANPELEQNSGY